MSEPQVRCTNCGIVWKPDEPLQYWASDSAWGYGCPVCQFHVPHGARAVVIPLTSTEFQARLGALLAEAHAGGLAPVALVPILVAELEFEAELAHHGRPILVQITDLDPESIPRVAMPNYFRREVLQRRASGE